ncbi:MAG: hypothetical protein WB697_02385 [Stellaceae bacterium]
MTQEAFAAPPPADIRSSAAEPSPQGWRDEVWAILVGALDGVLRSCYSVAPFTDDPCCVFRIGQGEARRDLLFADGTAIGAGEIIGTLHFWNEQLPPFSLSGPDMRWAVTMHHRIAYSLRALARFVETDPAWRHVAAFRAEAALSSRIGDKQLQRVTRRFGFECLDEPATWLRHLHELGECFNAWGLARAYNPAALAHQRFFRPYHDLWISRAALVARHGRVGDAGAGARAMRTAGERAPCPRS